MTPHPEADPHAASGTRPWVPARLIAVLAADIIDAVLIAAPLAAGLVLPGPAWLRLVLILISPLAVLHLLECHGRHGRWAGGAILGLRTVDEKAGLPTGTPRGLIAQAALGRAAGAITVNTRRGPDPSRGPLGEQPTIAELSPSRPRRSPSRDQLSRAPEPSPETESAPRQGHPRSAGPRRETAPSPFRLPQPQSSAAQAAPRAAARPTSSPRPSRPSDVPPPPSSAPSAAAFGPGSGVPSFRPPSSSASAPSWATPATLPPSLPPAVPPQPSRSSAAPVPPPRYALRLRSAHGWTWLLSSPTIIGGATRQIPALAPHGTVDIPGMGAALSDNHAHLELLDGSLYLADLGSAGGTRIIGLDGVIQQCAPSTRYRVPLPCTIELGAVRLSAELERVPA
ncbi:Uncharacterised protein [Actinomyces denticolens]|nr:MULTISPECIES: hypothetical protein [Actinomyces]SUU11531.1 Uncharacterised protein [Actinomyces denticolens]